MNLLFSAFHKPTILEDYNDKFIRLWICAEKGAG